jgi:hypothetical protein
MNIKEVREIDVLNLGAGVQSTTLYLMACRGELKIDYAIFADTGDEPAAVYQHLAWLQTLAGPPILVRSRGRLSDHLALGENSTGQKFAVIPAFTLGSAESSLKAKGPPRFKAGEALFTSFLVVPIASQQ